MKITRTLFNLKQHYIQATNRPFFFPYTPKPPSSQPWGVLTSINAYGCDINIMTSKSSLKKYVIKLCDLIDMKKYGKCHIIKFGTGNKEGYSLFQMIETSNIAGHFANEDKKLYIDIFSCKEYDSKLVADFTNDYFKANYIDYNIFYRK